MRRAACLVAVAVAAACGAADETSQSAASSVPPSEEHAAEAAPAARRPRERARVAEGTQPGATSAATAPAADPAPTPQSLIDRLRALAAGADGTAREPAGYLSDFDVEIATPPMIGELGVGFVSGGSLGSLVADITKDASLAAEAGRLLATTDDERVLSALAALARWGAFAPHVAALRDDLLRALDAEGPAERRIAAGSALLPRWPRAAAADRTAVLRRLAVETDPAVVSELAALAGWCVLTDADRSLALRAIARLDVPFEPGTPATQPARLARRNLYEVLAADAVLRDDWEPLLVRMTMVATEAEREDLIAGFALMGDYVKAPEPPAVGTPERAALLATRRSNLDRLYRATNGLAGRQRMIRSAQGGLRILPADANAPEPERRAAADLLRALAAFETDPETIGVLRAAIASIGGT